MAGERTGGCACAAVRYRLQSEPLIVQVPAFERLYEVEEVWPQTSLARIRG